MNAIQIKPYVVFALTSGLILAAALSVCSQGNAPNAQAVSQTGLLPVYGVDFAFDPSGVDAAQFPSQSASYPNFGVNATFQQVWDALKPSGFNVLRFRLDVRDPPGSANKLANLSVWAAHNNVKVVPILIGADQGQPLGSDFSANVSAFIQAALSVLKSGSGENLKAYSQILAYQLEDEMNHAGRHAAISPEAAQLRILQAAAAIHKAEQEALKDSGSSLTPLMVNASFDYELIKFRAIAGATLSDEAYANAYNSMKRFLAELASSSDVDVIGVDWFAGSISAGGPDKFSNLLRALTADFAGKQIVFTTGSSTAWNSADDQKKFYALAFANLADFHVSEGVDAPFVGVFYHEALGSQTTSPAPNAAGDMAKWDWGARADELARMWNGGASSEVMSWWLKQIESNMGLMLQTSNAAGTSLTAQPAQAGLTQIANTVGQANAATATSSPAAATDSSTANPTNGTSQPSSTSGSNPGLSQALKQKAQEGLMSLLDHVFQDLGNLIGPNGNRTASNGGNAGTDSTTTQPAPTTTALLALAKQDVTINPMGPQAGGLVTLTVNVHNQSSNADASNLVVAIVDDASNVLSQVTNAAVASNSSQSFSLQWTPTEAKTYPVSAVIADANLNVLVSVALDPVTVTAAPNSSGPASPGAPPRMAGLLGRGDLGRLMLPLGSPRVPNLTVGTPGRSLFAGEPSPVAISLTNPYSRPLTNVTATLLVDGRETQSKTVGNLLPGQSRSLLFTNTTIPQAGKHEVRVVLETREAGSRKGLVTTQVDVASRQANATGISAAKSVPQRSVLPGRINVGGMAVALNPSARMPVNSNDQTNGQRLSTIRPITSTTVATSNTKQPDRQIKPGPTPSAPNTNASDSALRIKPLPKPDLSVSANDISYRPDAPKSGGPLAFSANIHNIGKADARQARITCVLLADGRAVTSRDFVADIGANGIYVARWNVTTPAGRRLRFEVSVILDGDNDARNNRAAVEINLTNTNAPPPPLRTTPGHPSKP